jgi:polyferredoxin
MGPPKTLPINKWWLRRVIARSVGIIAIALGFVIGLYGLDHPASHWLPAALGLLVTGMVAQGYGLYCSVKRMQQLNS